MAANKTKDNRPGVHSIDHFAIEVPDLDVGKRFFDCFGLRVEEKTDGLHLYGSGSDHRWGRLIKGPRKRLAYLALNCYAKDLEPLRDQAKAAGAKSADPHSAGSVEGFWFNDNDGNLLQVRVGPKTMPDAKTPLIVRQVREGERGVLGRSSYGKVQPRRLSHVLLFCTDVPGATRFYADVLGMCLSDHAQDLIAFMHGRHGSDHHLVAFAKSEARGWHHCAWDVASFEDVGRGADQMAKAGYTKGWGTGRHVLGSNYFHYVQDPWGSFSEYSADIDYVAADQVWESGDWPPEDSLHLWGPDVPEIFLTNTEAHAT